MDPHSTPPTETPVALENALLPVRVEYPMEESLVDRFHRVARRNRDRTAVVHGDSSLDYGQLDELSDRLAKELRAKGIAHEELLGICLERSVEMVVATLAVLKAGGAYLPLDPTNPPKRLALILAESGTRLVLTHSRLRHLVEGPGREIVCLDRPESLEPAGASSVDEQETETKPEDLAYVIYTSGSTGTPKGVEITQANVLRLFDATENWFHFGPEDVWSMFHSFAFDFSVWEMWGALLFGGKLAIVPYDVSRTPKAFYEFLVQEGVTILNQTPSAFRQLVQAEAAIGVHPDLKVRTVVFGGEALELVSLAPWIARHGDAHPELINMYGITETTVHVTYRRIRQQDVEARRGSVIGVPIPDLEVRLLDSSLQPVGVGEEGEIFVGGAGVARGYRGRKALTAERFVEDPTRPGHRLYRSGDLARFTADGEMEYIGRADLQVKIRGFRIELGEIEAALRGQPGVEDAVVIDREDTPGDQRLAAYLICPEPADRDPGRLREALRQVLPEYMVPSGYVFMDVLPLNHNGKLDRKALPRPGYESNEEYVAPRTEAERRIAEIWQRSLGEARVGLDDDFIDLGGHSLLGVQVVDAINASVGSDLTVIQFFDHPTIRALAALVEENASPGEEQRSSSRPSDPAPMEASPTVDRADLDRVERALADVSPHHPGRHGDRMRESLLCRWILAPLYGFSGRWLRSLLQKVILKLEGGGMFSRTMRRLYRTHLDMEIGDYSSFCFDVDNFKSGTRFGRYCSVMRTARFETANHPSNTISSHGVFYQQALGFSSGFDIPRNRIEVGHDVHIGHNVTLVYPARKIGDGAIIGAGSLVVEDVPPYAIVAGYPARVIRYRFSQETIRKLQELRWWDASLEGLEQVVDEFMRPLDGKQVR